MRERYEQRLREEFGDDSEITHYPSKGELREIKMRLKSWTAAGFPFTFMFFSRSGVPHVDVLLERKELPKHEAALRDWSFKVNDGATPIVTGSFAPIPGWAHWCRVLLEEVVPPSESFDESVADKAADTVLSLVSLLRPHVEGVRP